MPAFEVSQHTSMSRYRSRGSYDKASIYAILDEVLEVTISYIANDLPMAIPMGFVRIDNSIYIHGSVKSHFIKQVCSGKKVCLTASLLDGLVLANSAFSHSFNYRSVVAFSNPYLVTDEHIKVEILKAFTDKLLPGRWEDNIIRPSKEEINATAVVCLPLTEASAKIRQGPPKNTSGLETTQVWTGIVPVKRTWQKPVPAELSDPELPLPGFLQRITKIG